MAYKTGHTREARWEFRITGTNIWSYDNRPFPHNPKDPIPDTPSADASFTINAGGFNATVVPYFASVIPAPMLGDPFTIALGVTCDIGGTPVTQSSNYYIAAGSVQTVSYTYDITMVVVANATEWFVESVIGSGWFDSIPDAPAYNRATFYLEHTEGGSETGTIGGASHTVSPFPSGVGMTLGCSMSVGATANDSASSTWAIEIIDAPVEYTVITAANAVGVTVNGAGTATAGSGGVSVSLAALSKKTVTGTAGAGLGGDRDYSASGVLRMMDDAYPDTVGVGVGGHVGGAVNASGGSWSASGTQKNYLLTATAAGATDTRSVDEYAPLSAALIESDLIARGDEPKNRRCTWRGWLIPGIAITQAATFPLLDNEDAPSEWDEATTVAGGVATLSTLARLTFTPKLSGLSYRYLRFQVRSVGAANQSLSLTIPANEITDDDRYDVSGGGTVDYLDPYGGDEEPDKEWNFKTGADGAWQTITIDLCSPDNLTDLTDAQDSRFPVPSRMPLYYGVSRIAYFDFGGVPSGSVDIEIKDIQFVMLSEYPSFDYLPTFYRNSGRTVDGQFVMNTDWATDSAKWRADEILDSGTTVEYYKRRFLAGRCDGKAGVEESDHGYTKTTTSGGTSSWSFGGPSIASFAGSINAIDTVTITPPAGSTPRVTGPAVRYPGISATISTPASDSSINLRNGYLNRNLPATYLAGMGAWFERGAGWHYGLNNTGTVPVQPLYTQVEWYAGAGDVFGHVADDTGTRSGPIQLRAAIYLRGGGQALVWGTAEDETTYTPVGGRNVRVEEAGINRGSGTTDASYGYTQTGTPYLQAVSTETLDGSEWNFTAPTGSMIVSNSPERTITIRPLPRRRVRGSFRVTVVVDPGDGRVALVTHPHSWSFGKVLVSLNGKRVKWRRSNGPYRTGASLLPFVTIQSAPDEDAFDFPAVSLEFTPLELIRVRWQQSDGIYESTSTDDGATWTEPIMVIENGKYPVLATATDRSGLVLGAAFIPDSGDDSVGVINASWVNRATERTDGTTPPTIYTFKKYVSGVTSDLRITSAGFDLVQLPEHQARWCLSCIPEGETANVDFICADETEFVFTRVAP